MNFDEKLAELYIDLPEPPTDIGGQVSAVATGKNIYIGGVLPFAEGKVQFPGKVGIEVRLDSAKLAARAAAILLLAIVAKELGGSLNKVKRFIKLDAFVASGAEFRDHDKVLDGASDLLVQVFGQNGKCARSVAGVASLPKNACLSISAVVEIK